MTECAKWFRYQLKATGDGFLWAFEQIEPVLHRQLPPAPHYMGTWSPRRLLWHVTEYERCLAVPSMRQWLNGSIPGEDAWLDDDATWSTVQDRTSGELTENFRAVHHAHMLLVDQLADIDWAALHETIWGSKSLAWVVTKTYQHRLEHGDTLLRMSLRWRDAEENIAQKAAQRQG
jgi:hypothetical protein